MGQMEKGGERSRVSPLSVAEAAVQVGVTSATMSRWVKSGKVLAFVTLGGHYRIWQRDLDAAIAAAQGEDESDPRPAGH